MKKAFLIGINEYPTARLNGCVNDIQDIKSVLTSHYGFKQEDITCLLDEKATTQNILVNLNKLVLDLKSGDTFYFHYSGHGAQQQTQDPSESDHMYQIICPVDFDWSSQKMITDAQFKQIFAKIPVGVIFNWVSDSCHSGGLTRSIVKPCLKQASKKSTPRLFPHKNLNKKAIIHNSDNVMKTASVRSITNGTLDVGFLSGCRSDQTSSDAYFNDRPNGALTYFLLRNMIKGQKKSLFELSQDIRRDLASNGYQQQPQTHGTRINKPLFS